MRRYRKGLTTSEQKINYFKYNFFSQNLLSLEPVQELEKGWQSLVEQDPLLEKSFEVLQRLTL